MNSNHASTLQPFCSNIRIILKKKYGIRARTRNIFYKSAKAVLITSISGREQLFPIPFIYSIIYGEAHHDFGHATFTAAYVRTYHCA